MSPGLHQIMPMAAAATAYSDAATKAAAEAAAERADNIRHYRKTCAWCICLFLLLVALTAGSCFLLVVSGMAMVEHDRIHTFDKGVIYTTAPGSYYRIKKVGCGYQGQLIAKGAFDHDKAAMFNVTLLTHPRPFIIECKSKNDVRVLLADFIAEHEVPAMISPQLQAYTKNVTKSWSSGIVFGIAFAFLFGILAACVCEPIAKIGKEWSEL
jgi:hypothetical protein